MRNVETLDSMPDGRQPIPDEPEWIKDNPYKSLVVEDSYDWFENPPEKQPEVIPGVIALGDYLLLGGASKSKKTWTLSHLALAAASGSEAFGIQFKQTRVLYINFELKKDSFHNRLRMICRHLNISYEKGELLTINMRQFISASGPLLDTLSFINAVQVLAHKHDVTLIVIDPIYKMYADSIISENDNIEIARQLNLIRLHLLSNNNHALIMSHHYSKGGQWDKPLRDKFSGAGAFARDADALMGITDHEEEEHAIVEFELRDYAPIPKATYRWDKCVWVVTGIDSTREKGRSRNSKAFRLEPEDVVELITDEANPMPMKAIKTVLMKRHGMSDTIIKTQIMNYASPGHEFTKDAHYYVRKDNGLARLGVETTYISRRPIPQAFFDELKSKIKAEKHAENPND